MDNAKIWTFCSDNRVYKQSLKFLIHGTAKTTQWPRGLAALADKCGVLSTQMVAHNPG